MTSIWGIGAICLALVVIGFLWGDVRPFLADVFREEPDWSKQSKGGRK